MKLNFYALLYVAFLPFAGVVSATELPHWQDPEVVEVNRYPMTATFHTDGNRLSLNGIWDFKWYETVESRSLDFFKMDYDTSDWGTMPVPGMWELNGYDIPLYELACMGDSFCATMLRSVNGGGTESFDSWNDFYGMFFYALENK